MDTFFFDLAKLLLLFIKIGSSGYVYYEFDIWNKLLEEVLKRRWLVQFNSSTSEP